MICHVSCVTCQVLYVTKQKKQKIVIKNNTQNNNLSLGWQEAHCHVMSCHVMSCHVMSCHVMSCHIMSCHVMSCHVMSCHVMSCHVMSCHVMSCYVMSYHAMSCLVMSFTCHIHQPTTISNHISPT